MDTLPIIKVEAIGNNFVLLNGLTLPEMDWSALAQDICAHHFGVGSDGLLVVQRSDKADFCMRMFNPDGSEDACGNGLRCTAAYLQSVSLLSRSRLTIEAIDGLHNLEICSADERSAVVKVEMGQPSLDTQDLPAMVEADRMIDYPLHVDGRDYQVTGVLVGTPHIVILAPAETFWEKMPKASKIIERLPIFPQRVSVTWCAVESPESLRIRTWERAVGPTMGCGTGASAALVAANIHGLVGTRASATSPGGTLEVEWPEKAEIYTTGPASVVFEGTWPLLKGRRHVANPLQEFEPMMP